MNGAEAKPPRGLVRQPISAVEANNNLWLGDPWAAATRRRPPRFKGVPAWILEAVYRLLETPEGSDKLMAALQLSMEQRPANEQPAPCRARQAAGVVSGATAASSNPNRRGAK